jgi:hypothetical protein
MCPALRAAGNIKQYPERTMKTATALWPNVKA